MADFLKMDINLISFFFTIVSGLALCISIIFAFFATLYSEIDKMLSKNLSSLGTMIPLLEEELYSIDEWLIENRAITGPVLIVLSAHNLIKFITF